MIEMTIDRVATDPNNHQRIVWLKTLQGDRQVPIVIGEAEAFSIALGMAGQDPPRPLAHDLMHTILDQLFTSVEKVEIVDIEEGTFYAELTLSGPDGSVSMDARPSDCLALAVRAGAPIYLNEELLATEGIEEGSADSEAASPQQIVHCTPDAVDTAIAELVSETGLKPTEDAIKESLEVTLRKLRWRMELAVKGEDYERAAALRDQIAEQESPSRSPVNGA